MTGFSSSGGHTISGASTGDIRRARPLGVDATVLQMKGPELLITRSTPVDSKLTRREAELLDRLTREYGFISKSEAIRSAVRLYLNLLELRSKDRLRVLQLINELIAPSSKTSSDLVEEGHREEDEL
jgi:Arc/MetJ-type ribon-helix-helix transcriptional regulator